jgi:hypothetical protein
MPTTFCKIKEKRQGQIEVENYSNLMSGNLLSPCMKGVSIT